LLLWEKLQENEGRGKEYGGGEIRYVSLVICYGLEKKLTTICTRTRSGSAVTLAAMLG
jgi:hypothetical protein